MRKHTFFPALCAVLAAAAGCGAQPSPVNPSPSRIGPADAAGATAPAGVPVATGVLEIGRLAHPRLMECSGVIASRQFPGTYWVHNDGGGSKRQTLYAIDRTGLNLAEFQLVDGTIDDWEDIAIDDQRQLYLGDIGNNDARRNEVAVHQIDEPNPAASSGVVHFKKTWRLRYADARFDAEGLFVWKNHGYIVSKVFKDARAVIHRFSLEDTAQPITLEFVARTKIESPVTGADISSDGRRLAIVAKSGAFLFLIDGNVALANKEKGYQVKFRHEKIEGCTFSPDGLIATAESREIYLYLDPMFRQ